MSSLVFPASVPGSQVMPPGNFLLLQVELLVPSTNFWLHTGGSCRP